MTDSDSSPTPHSTYGAHDYAHEMISFLKQRNRAMMLLLILMVMIVVAAGISAVAMYFNNQQTVERAITLEARLQEQEQQNASLQKSKEATDEQLKLLESQFSAVLQATRELASMDDVPEPKALSEETLISLTDAFQVAADKIASLEAENQLLTSAVDNLKQQNSMLKTAYSETQSSLSDTTEESKQALRNALEQIDQLNRQVENRKAAFEALAKRYKSTKESATKYQDEIDTARAQLKSRNAALKKSQQTLETLTGELNVIKAEHAKISKELEAARRVIAGPSRAVTQPRPPGTVAQPASGQRPAAAPAQAPPAAEGGELKYPSVSIE